MWREREGEEGLVLRGRIISGLELTAACQSAPDEPETVDCSTSLPAHPSIGGTARQSKVKVRRDKKNQRARLVLKTQDMPFKQ